MMSQKHTLNNNLPTGQLQSQVIGRKTATHNCIPASETNLDKSKIKRPAYATLHVNHD